MALDNHTVEMAKEFANNEAEIQGFEIGSPKWKAAFKNYCEFATGTMSVGRNPRTQKNPIRVVSGLYPDILGANGIAGRWAKNYRGQDGKGVPLEAVQGRIMSSVTNLVKLIENSELGTKTTTHGYDQGKIADSNMSDLQMPTKMPYQTEAEYLEKTKAVVRAQMTRDLLTNVILESLVPAMEITKKDVDSIMSSVNWDVKNAKDFMATGLRKSWVEALRGVVGPKFKSLNIRKIIFGG